MTTHPVTAAAKVFLRDAYEAQHGRAPTDQELTDWVLLQWTRIRQQAALASTTPAGLLGRLTSDSFPGIKGAAK